MRKFGVFILCLALIATFSDQSNSDTAVPVEQSKLVSEKINVDDKEYDRTQFINAFNNIAFSTYISDNVFPEEQLTYPILKTLPGTVSEAKNIKDAYPWLYELRYREEGMPKYVAVNKWTKPIRISLGFPNDLKPIRTPTSERYFIYTNFPKQTVLPEVVENVKRTINGITPVITELTGLPTSFLEPEKETPSDFADIRIVLVPNILISANVEKSRETPVYPIWETYFKLGRPSIGTSTFGQDVSHVQWKDFRQTIEKQLVQTGIRFTPYSATQVDGYFLVNSKNEIQKAFCYIWQGHTAEIIQLLTQECVVRSLGLPDAASGIGNSLLRLWNDKVPSPPPANWKRPKGLSGLDKLIVKTLYSEKIKPGMTPHDVMKQFAD